MRARNQFDRVGMVRYLVVAFGVTWVLWVPALVWSSRTGAALPTLEAGPAVWLGLSGVGIAFAVAFQLAVYGPLLGALAGLAGKPQARAAWAQSIVRFRVPARWYAFVLLVPLGISAAAIAVGAIVERRPPTPPAGGSPALSMLPVMLAIQLLTSGLEEPGWRGYLLPLLREGFNREEAAWRVGLIWAAWHLPFVIWLNLAAPLWTLPLTLLGFAMGVIAMSFVQTWVYERTGSLWMCILLHAWANLANTFAFAWMQSPLMPVATSVLTWLLVAWLLKRTPGWKDDPVVAEGI